METNEVMDNVEIVDTISDAVKSTTDGKVNPMVVGGVAAVGVAAIGLGHVLWNKAIKPGAAKAKAKIADAKAKRSVKKNDTREDIKISDGKVVVDEDSKE